MALSTAERNTPCLCTRVHACLHNMQLLEPLESVLLCSNMRDYPGRIVQNGMPLRFMCSEAPFQR